MSSSAYFVSRDHLNDGVLLSSECVDDVAMLTGSKSL